MCAIYEDIVDAILDSYGRWWPRDYARLARVSSVWVNPVRARLYACPNLNSEKSCKLLARTLEHNPRLIPLVRSLWLRPRLDTWSESNLCDSSGVERLLALTRLESLTLCGFTAPLSVHLLRCISSPHTITELWLYYPLIANFVFRDFDFCALEWDSELFRRFTSLRKLSIDGFIRLNICASEKGITQDPTLEELSLSLVSRSPSTSFHGLLCNKDAWSKLRTLSISHDVFLNYRHDLLFTCSSIENLVLDGDYESDCFTSRSDTTQGPIIPLQNIRRLKLQRYCLNIDLLVDIAETFPFIEELDLSWLSDWIEPQKVLTFFDADTVDGIHLRNLQRLIWNRSIRVVRIEQPQVKRRYLDSLARICAARKVELVFNGFTV